MCTRYISPEEAEIERFWRIDRRNQPEWWAGAQVFPRALGPFIRLQPGEDGQPATTLVIGQFGLIPWFAKEAKLPYATQNARSEEIAAKASFKQPWAKGQRCIIPAWSFDEPCWETGKNVWWRFRRADGTPWGLAGLWNAWTDKSTGEIVESYTMLTVNADDHPLMRRMHKPDPKLPADQQDKRSVVAIEPADVQAWLTGTVEEVRALLHAPAAAVIDGKPAK
jgi:putative SOS response-associated peptidase YedK